MGIIINFLKELSSLIPSSEFVLLTAMLIGLLVYALKVIISAAVKKGLFTKLFDSSDENIVKIIEKVELLDKVVTKSLLEESLEKVLNAIEEVRDHTIHRNETSRNERNEVLRSQISDSMHLRKEIENLAEIVKKEFINLKHQQELQDLGDRRFDDVIKDIINKIHELDQRLISHINKMDEMARSNIPEFRNYHKELTKDLGEISRDIALVERSVQTQINSNNNNNSVRLR